MFNHPLNTLDNIAFYWFGWKDYSFEYKPVFQIMKELYDEDKRQDVPTNDWYVRPSIYDTDWIDTSIQASVRSNYSLVDYNFDDDNTSMDEDVIDEVSEEDAQDYSFYDQAIYKKFSYS